MPNTNDDLARAKKLLRNTSFEPLIVELERLRAAQHIIEENITLVERHAATIRQSAPLTYRAIMDVVNAHRSTTR